MNEATSQVKDCLLLEGLEKLEGGRYILPSFQREFVWKPEQIEELFYSIYCSLPFGTMLFWRLSKQNDNGKVFEKEVFYKFIHEYHVGKNDDPARKSPMTSDEYHVVLDGQQRLTSLFIGLKGCYYKSSKNKKESKYCLYFDTSLEKGNPFKFKKIDGSNTPPILYLDPENEHKWILVSHILKISDIDDFQEENNLHKQEKKNVRTLKEKLKELKLVYIELSGVSYDDAVNVFVKVNSGGTPLKISDILNAIIISTWKKKNSRELFKNLVDRIDDSDINFKIDTAYIVKAILYLFNNDVRYKISGFSNFIVDVEDKWDNVSTAIIDTFMLLKTFGLSRSNLTSYNATLPILFYVYHRRAEGISSKRAFEEDRCIIKKWIMSALLMEVFGGTSDATLAICRSVFLPKTGSGSEIAIDESITLFPSQKIIDALDDDWIVPSKESLREKLGTTQKGKPYSIILLSLLYPDFKINEIEYEQDHIHPESRYNMMPDGFKSLPNSKKRYNSIVNLQLLVKSENASKQDMPLSEWVKEETKNTDREKFLKDHLIPTDASLEETDVADFFNKRENLLIDKLMEYLATSGDTNSIGSMKTQIATKVAMMLMKEYGWRYEKCFSIVGMSNWFHQKQSIDELKNTDPQVVFEAVRTQIEKNEIN